MLVELRISPLKREGDLKPENVKAQRLARGNDRRRPRLADGATVPASAPRSDTPSREFHCLTAFAMTAGTVMELDSPSPFDPSGVRGEGDTTWAISIAGASPADGTT